MKCTTKGLTKYQHSLLDSLRHPIPQLRKERSTLILVLVKDCTVQSLQAPTHTWFLFRLAMSFPLHSPLLVEIEALTLRVQGRK